MIYKKKDGKHNPTNTNKLKKFGPLSMADKTTYNRQLFTIIAPVYGLATRLLSFNRDQAWKKKLVKLLPEAPATGKRILDLACGNGDITWLLAQRYPQAELWGVDLNPDMLALARRRFRNFQKSNPRTGVTGSPIFHPVRLLEENMLKLSAPDDYFDLVTGGYALRNAPDLKQALQEIKRVLKKGGTAAFLDFSKPAFKPLQFLQLILLRIWGELWGWLLHHDPAVYGYIAASLSQFPDRSSLLALLAELGFGNVRMKLLLGGFIALTLFTKV
jgi:demethylmenaquinone methyltransferase/2-methoxy-6-polyprenyl-1,4-benzoquinol methylase